MKNDLVTVRAGFGKGAVDFSLTARRRELWLPLNCREELN